MKLRVKFVTQPAGQACRMEVAATAGEYELRQTVAAAIASVQHIAPADIHLSLNKKDLLCFQDGATVQSLGVCSGDTIWVLSSEPVQGAMQSQQAGPSAAQPSVDTITSAARAPITQPVAEASGSEQHQSTLMDISSAAPAAPSSTGVAAVSAPSPEPCTDPGPAEHVGHSDAPSGSALNVDSPQAPQGPFSLQRVLADAAVEVCTSHQLLLLVVQAAMMECGFVKAQDTPASTADATAPQCTRFICPTAAALSTPDQPQAPAPTAKLIPLVMGHFLIIHASIELPGASSSTGSNDTGRRSGVVTVQVNTARHVSAEAQQQLQEQGQQPASLMHAGCFLAFPELWRSLKDGLGLPLLAAAYQAAGRTAPLGLMVLPQELLMAVLQQLQALELAALSGTCTMLHHAASEDRLWRSLFDVEFPHATLANRHVGQMRGWKMAFGLSWSERRQQRKRRPHHPMAPVPFPLPMPGGPSFNNPFGPSNIIGGDFDRFPMPFPGGPPIGLPFPGQGIPRQGPFPGLPGQGQFPGLPGRSGGRNPFRMF